MQLLQDGVIAALAAVGLATIVWFTVTALTHPRERVRSETAVIVPARGAAEALEHTVRTLESERYASGGFSRIIDPLGAVLAQSGGEEEIVTADLDLSSIAPLRARVPVFHDRRPELYRL